MQFGGCLGNNIPELIKPKGFGLNIWINGELERIHTESVSCAAGKEENLSLASFSA